MARRSVSPNRAMVRSWLPPGVRYSRAAWMKRIAASPRLTTATRVNTKRSWPFSNHVTVPTGPTLLAEAVRQAPFDGRRGAQFGGGDGQPGGALPADPPRDAGGAAGTGYESHCHLWQLDPGAGCG